MINIEVSKRLHQALVKQLPARLLCCWLLHHHRLHLSFIIRFPLLCHQILMALHWSQSSTTDTIKVNSMIGFPQYIELFQKMLRLPVFSFQFWKSWGLFYMKLVLLGNFLHSPLMTTALFSVVQYMFLVRWVGVASLAFFNCLLFFFFELIMNL